MRKFPLLLALLLVPGIAPAKPIAFQDGVTLMAEYGGATGS